MIISARTKFHSRAFLVFERSSAVPVSLILYALPSPLPFSKGSTISVWTIFMAFSMETSMGGIILTTIALCCSIWFIWAGPDTSFSLLTELRGTKPALGVCIMI
ncbi:hypothetical protein ES703_83652 [subsurface metagenome]